MSDLVRVGDLARPDGQADIDTRLRAEMARILKPWLAYATSLPGAKDADSFQLKGFANILVGAGISATEADAAYRSHLEASKWAPTPAEIIERARAARPTVVYRPPASISASVPSREERDAILAARSVGLAVLKDRAKIEFVDDPEDVARTQRERDEQIARLRAGKGNHT